MKKREKRNPSQSTLREDKRVQKTKMLNYSQWNFREGQLEYFVYSCLVMDQSSLLVFIFHIHTFHLLYEVECQIPGWKRREENCKRDCGRIKMHQEGAFRATNTQCMLIIPVLGRLTQEDHDFKHSLEQKGKRKERTQTHHGIKKKETVKTKQNNFYQRDD